MTDKDKVLVPLKNKSVNVSLIKNMSDLKSEINFLKTRLKLNELELKTRTQELPKKTMQYATAKFFLHILPVNFLKVQAKFTKHQKAFSSKKQKNQNRSVVCFHL